MLLKHVFAKKWWKCAFAANWFTHFLPSVIYILYDAVINFDKTCKSSLHRGIHSLPRVVAVVGVSIFLLE